MEDEELMTRLDECIGCSTIASTNVSDYEVDCSDQFAGPGPLSSPYFQAIVTIMYSAIFFVALIGNGAVCFIVRAFPRMRTVTNYFIANLALGDILMSLFCVPFSFVSLLVLNHWPFGSLLCRLVNYSQVVSVLVSAYTLVALAADRYRAITSPLRPRLSKPAAKAAIAAVWVGALATALPTSLVSALSSPTKWHELCERSICREEWPLPEQSYYYSMALMTLQFAVPLAVLVFTYARIALAVWGGKPPGEAENSRDKRMAKSKRKMIKMMVTVVIVFTVCWLPLNILIILWSINVDDSSWDTWEPLPYVWFAFHWLAMSHSCYNPIIYCYMNARFRYGFIQVAAKFPCLRGCLSTAVRRAARADLHNGVSGVGMTETTLQRVNTCTSYVSVRKRGGRCSCSPARNSCSPARSNCSHTRSTCSPGRSTCSSNVSSLSPIKNNCNQFDSPCNHKRGSYYSHTNTLSPNMGTCNSDTCINRRNSSSGQSLNYDSFPRSRKFSQGSSAIGNCNNSSMRINCPERSGSLIGRGSPARAASLITTQGTICTNDRRHVTYLEDQI